MNLKQEFARLLQAGVKENEPMSRHTSWQVGGLADYYLLPADEGELQEIVRLSREKEVPLFVFGNGTNLLVRDGGIRGLVVHIGAPFSYIRREGSSLRVGAGTPLTLLARRAAREGLQGLGFGGGIPGSLGGALVMNAGAFGSYIGRLVAEIRLVRFAGEAVTLGREEIAFGYRRSNLAGRGIIVEALLELEPGDPAALQREVEKHLAERRRRHPALPSAGSVFRNPTHRPAGSLIEAAGGKGLSVGSARVSEQHANFIVNPGGASAGDIERLIGKVQRLVREKFAVELQPEVRIVGEER
ncbi:MAG: UDP-N-acetylmuramate dehydrogenase [Firmicutes bacterium]|nr:UDP-N-acetylmuramate dehydrogenase [Bacillota bacterium]